MSYLINDSFNSGTGLTSLYFLGNSLSNLETKTEHDNDIASINNTLSNLSTYSVQIGTFTKNTGDANTTQTVNHTLGKIPSLIEFNYQSYNDSYGSSYGWYDGTNYNIDANANAHCIYTGATASYTQTGNVISVSSSNFVIDWARDGSSGALNKKVSWKVSG